MLFRILSFPMRDRKEYGNDRGGEKLQEICIESKRDNRLNNDVVNDRTDRDRKKTEREILEYLGEQSLSDNDSRKTDNYCALTHLDVGKALILREECARKCNESVRDHNSENLVEACVDALRAAHILIDSGCTDRASHLGSEKPIKNGDQNDQHHTNGNYRVMERKFLDPTQRNEQIRLIYVYRLIRLAHNFEVDRVKRKLCQDTRKNGWNSHKGVQKSGYRSREKSRDECRKHSKPQVASVQYQHYRNRAARCKGAVNSKVGDVENTVSYVNSYRHNAPYKSL